MTRTAHWLAALLISAVASAAAAATDSEIAQARGTVTIRQVGADKPAQKGDALGEGTVITTGAGSEALVTFDDGGKLLVRPETSLHFEEMRQDAQLKRQRVTVRVVRGGLRYVSGVAGTKKMAFRSGELTIGLRGTDIDLVVAARGAAVDSGTYLRVNSGEAEMVAPDGTSLVVGKDETAVSAANPQMTRSFVPRPPFVRLRLPPPTLFERSALDALMQ